MSTDTHFIASHMQTVRATGGDSKQPTKDIPPGLSDEMTRRKYCARFALNVYGKCLEKNNRNSSDYCHVNYYNPAFIECINNKDL